MNREGSSRVKKFKLILGIILVIIGSLNLIGGGMGFFLNMNNSDPDGYHLSDVYEIRSNSCAFLLTHLPTRSDLPAPRTQWTVEPVNSEKELFVGWGTHTDVSLYTSGYPFETPLEWEWYYSPYSSTVDIPKTIIWNQNASNITPPGSEKFWMDNITSNDSIIQMRWDPRWEPETFLKTLVIMNSDGSKNISADISFGSRIPLFQTLPYPLFLLGIILIIVGLAMIANSKKQ